MITANSYPTHAPGIIGNYLPLIYLDVQPHFRPLLVQGETLTKRTVAFSLIRPQSPSICGGGGGGGALSGIDLNKVSVS